MHRVGEAEASVTIITAMNQPPHCRIKGKEREIMMEQIAGLDSAEEESARLRSKVLGLEGQVTMHLCHSWHPECISELVR